MGKDTSKDTSSKDTSSKDTSSKALTNHMTSGTRTHQWAVMLNMSSAVKTIVNIRSPWEVWFSLVELSDKFGYMFGLGARLV